MAERDRSLMDRFHVYIKRVRKRKQKKIVADKTYEYEMHYISLNIYVNGDVLRRYGDQIAVLRVPSKGVMLVFPSQMTKDELSSIVGKMIDIFYASSAERNGGEAYGPSKGSADT